MGSLFPMADFSPLVVASQQHSAFSCAPSFHPLRVSAACSYQASSSSSTDTRSYSPTEPGRCQYFVHSGEIPEECQCYALCLLTATHPYTKTVASITRYPECFEISSASCISCRYPSNHSDSTDSSIEVALFRFSHKYLSRR